MGVPALRVFIGGGGGGGLRVGASFFGGIDAWRETLAGCSSAFILPFPKFMRSSNASASSSLLVSLRVRHGGGGGGGLPRDG